MNKYRVSALCTSIPLAMFCVQAMLEVPILAWWVEGLLAWVMIGGVIAHVVQNFKLPSEMSRVLEIWEEMRRKRARIELAIMNAEEQE